ncbi:unnamed protein product [Brassica oleracea var. botrytis]
MALTVRCLACTAWIVFFSGIFIQSLLKMDGFSLLSTVISQSGQVRCSCNCDVNCDPSSRTPDSGSQSCPNR